MSEPTDDDEKRRKKAALTKVILILIFLGAIGVFALTVLGAILSGDGGSNDRPAAATTVTVIYRVTGNDRYLADLTYTNASGNVEQFDGAFLPWEMEIKVPVGQAVYISAQSTRDETKTIACEIRVNGQLLEQASSTGRFVIASCSGSAE